MLTPKEMEDLTEPWKPYRSLGERGRLLLSNSTYLSTWYSGLLHVGVTGREMNLTSRMSRWRSVDAG